MTIQLGFDGAIKLTRDATDADLRTVLDLTADRYREFTAAIDSATTDNGTYWRIVFAILSVNSPIDATFECYRALRLWSARFGRIPSFAKLASLIRNTHGTDGVVQYHGQKADYIRGFDAAWRSDKTQFLRNGDTDIAWRERIQVNTRGLGLAKASFAVALCAPSTSDICCVDTHIGQLFGLRPQAHIGKRFYLAVESKLRALAAEYNLSVFAVQWCLWDAKRGQVNAHSALGSV